MKSATLWRLWHTRQETPRYLSFSTSRRIFLTFGRSATAHCPIHLSNFVLTMVGKSRLPLIGEVGAAEAGSAGAAAGCKGITGGVSSALACFRDLYLVGRLRPSLPFRVVGSFNLQLVVSCFWTVATYCWEHPTCCATCSWVFSGNLVKASSMA